MKLNTIARLGCRRRLFAWVFPVALLVGCANTEVLRSSFNDYSAVYAETQNQQMLLNLARLHEGYPIYFFQLGQITAGFTISTSLGITGSMSRNIVGTPQRVLGGLATLGNTVVQNPSFILSPLAGDNFAKQLLQPISPLVFEQNFEQGWPVDQLMRILVERIEVTYPVSSKKPRDVFENNPWDGVEAVGADGKVNALADEAGEPTGYDHFLRACDLALQCQKAGVLHLVRTSLFVPVATWTGTDLKTSETRSALVTDVVSADKEGFVIEPAQDGIWEIGKYVDTESFQFDQPSDQPKMDFLLKSLQSNPLYSAENTTLKDTTKTAILELLQQIIASGISISDKSGANLGSLNNAGPDGKIKPTNLVQVRFVMRSLMGVITALATEQQAFEARKKDPQFSKFFKATPVTEHNPLLQLTWPNDKTPAPTIAALDFEGKHFAIADEQTAGDLRPSTVNRDVFRMLVQLSFQVTADPSSASNLTAPPAVQVRGN